MNAKILAATRAVLGAVVLSVVLSAICGSAIAQTLPAGFVVEEVVGGFNLPTAFTTLPDGRLLVTEKAGLVRVVKNGVLLPTPFIDLTATVNDYWDRGLLGIAADVNFTTNGYVYLLYTYENNAADYVGSKTGRLTRVTATGDVASLASRVTVLGTSVGSGCSGFAAGADCIPSDNPSHSVGNIKAASDGTLFVTLGEGASFNLVDDDALRAQDLNSLGGKLLHITRTGQGIATNPFWNGTASANRSKVWAYGFRNPFRFALDPVSGMPILGDVGWSIFEEINSPTGAAAGANFGWPCYEGNFQQSGYAPKAVCQALYAQGTGAVQFPTAVWSHSGGGSAATGGTFSSGTSFPSLYQGGYFYTDYAEGFIRFFPINSAGRRSGALKGLAVGLNGPVYMDTDGQNLLYVSVVQGEIRRIRYTGANADISYLSDRSWSAMTNGYGPVERDQSNGENEPEDGRVLSLKGVPYAKGLGAHAPSDVRFALNSSCTLFTAAVGVDDGATGTVQFQVFADGTKLFDSGVVSRDSATQFVSVNITGKSELRLVADPVGSITSDHADWADARVTCGPADVTRPTVTAVSPPAGAAGAGVTTDVTATFSEAMIASTLNTATVTLARQGTPIAATVTYDAGANTVTLDPAVSLATSTSYTATIKAGTTGVKDLAGNTLAANKVWTFTTGATVTTTSYLSDRSWTSMTNGVGPLERDRSNGEAAGGDGRVITLNGVTYGKGLGGAAGSTVRYALNRECSVLTASIGVDDEVGVNGSLAFQVWADGVKKYDSGVMRGTTATAAINVSIAGAAELALIITDGGNGNTADHGDWANAQVSCSSNAAPIATISQPLSTRKFKVGDTIAYAGSATDRENGTLPATSLHWAIVLFHCPGGDCHQHPFSSGSGTGGSFVAPDHGDDSYFGITLTATDSSGSTGSTTVYIQPQTVQFTLDTTPAGLQIVYGGVSATTPATFTTIVGSRHTIQAPSPQGNLAFASWSDGGAQQHDVLVGTASVKYVASYRAATGSTPAPADFDGDRSSDLAIWRSANGSWFIRESSQGYSTTSTYQWGVPGDLPILGDFDRDGRADVVVWRPGSGTWHVRESSLAYSVSSARTFFWGVNSDVPLAGDFDGDGRADLAVWRSSTGASGAWYLRDSSSGYTNTRAYQWGLPGDTPMAGDFDGDGRADLAIWRPTDGRWYLRDSSTGYTNTRAFLWGLPGDIPIAGDFDGDGRADLAVWRPSDGTWQLRDSSTGYTNGRAFQWGVRGDVPVPGDYDHDGKTDLAVYRPSIGGWFVLYSSRAYRAAESAYYSWGVSGDVPVGSSR
jgi:glucose/arabinose dehydrogenase